MNETKTIPGTAETVSETEIPTPKWHRYGKLAAIAVGTITAGAVLVWAITGSSEQTSEADVEDPITETPDPQN